MADPDYARLLVRPVSMKPPAESALRDAGRVIAMVHELHKAGYQRIRILPYMAPSGLYWRCQIADAGSFAPNGLSLASSAGPERVAHYSSAEATAYFGWADGASLTARAMARRFLTAFPAIASHGAGRDWAYAGWLADILGRAEHGSFVIFFADYPLDPDLLRLWQPPPVPAGI
jgi:hypothetical protein